MISMELNKLKVINKEKAIVDQKDKFEFVGSYDTPYCDFCTTLGMVIVCYAEFVDKSQNAVPKHMTTRNFASSTRELTGHVCTCNEFINIMLMNKVQINIIDLIILF